MSHSHYLLSSRVIHVFHPRSWEQLALYEFYKSKALAKKTKEEEIEQGLRQASPPLSPINPSLDDSVGKMSQNGTRSPVRKRFRSESPDEERSHRRSRSGSPRRLTKRADRSRSRSPSPRRSPSRSRSDSRSNSPVSMPSFLRQQQKSPTPPAEMFVLCSRGQIPVRLVSSHSFLLLTIRASVSFTKGLTQKLDENNRGHQLLRKMGWGGAGLGANEQGIAEPIKGGEVRNPTQFFTHTHTKILKRVLRTFSNPKNS